MAKRTKTAADPAGPILSPARTRVIYCGDNLEQLKKLPGGSVDLITMDPPFHSHRNDELFWGETKEQRAFQDRHESTQATIEFMRPRAVELARVLKKTGSFYYHCDWHASQYVKVMLGRNSRVPQLTDSAAGIEFRSLSLTSVVSVLTIIPLLKERTP